MDKFVPLLAEELDSYYDAGTGWPTMTVADPMDSHNTLIIPNRLNDLQGVIGRFQDFVYNNCKLGVFDYLRDQIENKHFSVQKYVPGVPYPDHYYVESMDIKHIFFAPCDRASVRCDIIVCAQIDATGTIYPLEDGYPWKKNIGAEPVPASGKITQWFRVICRFTFNHYGLYTSYDGVAVYTPSENSLQKLDDYLIPYIPDAEAYEGYAHRILQQYQPCVLEDPRPLDIQDLLEKLSLKVKKSKLSEDGSVMGRIIFKAMPGVTPAEEQSNLIEIDPAANRTQFSCRASLVHEIIHDIKDRYFMMAQNVYNQEATVFPNNRNQNLNCQDSHLIIAEAQNRELVRRLMFPYETSMYLADKWLRMLDAAEDPFPEDLEKVVRALSVFYKAPLYLAKQRMADFGYPMDGVLNYMDGEYIPAYMTTKAVPKGKSFDISYNEMLNLFIRDKNFNTMISSRKYTYVEHHVCLNNPIYIACDDAQKLHLTTYARRHIDECCILFSYICSNVGLAYECGKMHRVKGSEKTVSNAIEPATKSDQAIMAQELDFRMNTMASLPSGYTECFAKHLKRLHISQEKAAELSGLSKDTIRRLKNAEQHSLRTLLTVTLSIGLECCCIVDLVEKGRYGFLLDDRFHAACKMILCIYFHITFEQFNDKLTQLGFEALVHKELC